MNEPSENRLGCNALFTSHYSLIQQLSRNYRYSSIAACAADKINYFSESCAMVRNNVGLFSISSYVRNLCHCFSNTPIFLEFGETSVKLQPPLTYSTL